MWDLAVFDVTKPSAPSDPEYIEIYGKTIDITINGNYSYIGCTDYLTDEDFSGLVILDISDPSNIGSPIIIETISKLDNLFVYGPTLYGTCTNYIDHIYAIVSIDISDPLNPGEPIYYYLTCNAEKLLIANDVLYISQKDIGLLIFNLTDTIDNITPVIYPLEFRYPQVHCTQHNTLYLNEHWGSGGVYKLDISDPMNPKDLELIIESSAYDVIVSENTIIIAHGSYLDIYDFSDLSDIKLLESNYVAGTAYEATLVGSYVFVAVSAVGLKTYYIGNLLYETEEQTTNGASGLVIFDFIVLLGLIVVTKSFIQKRRKTKI